MYDDGAVTRRDGGTDGAAAELQELVDEVAAATGAPTTLEDRDLHLVASSGHDDVIDEVRRTSILRRRSSAQVQELFAGFGIARAQRPLRIPGGAVPGLLGRWCVPVRWRGVTHGYLWLLDPDERVSAARLDALTDVVVQVAATLALRARARDRSSWAVGELLSGDAGSRARAVEELRRDGLLPADPGAPLVVVALAPRDASPLGPVNSWLLPRGVLSAPVGHRAALVVPAGAPEAAGVAARAARTLTAQHPGGVAAGVSGPVAPGDGHAGWRQADAALRVARGGAGGVSVRTWEGLGAHRLLALAEPAALTAVVVDARARALLDGDPDLLLTARTYLDLAGSAQRTARALSVHRQTLYARLRRVREVTGVDLDDGRERLALHLALVLAEEGGSREG